MDLLFHGSWGHHVQDSNIKFVEPLSQLWLDEVSPSELQLFNRFWTFPCGANSVEVYRTLPALARKGSGQSQVRMLSHVFPWWTLLGLSKTGGFPIDTGYYWKGSRYRYHHWWTNPLEAYSTCMPDFGVPATRFNRGWIWWPVWNAAWLNQPAAIINT